LHQTPDEEGILDGRLHAPVRKHGAIDDSRLALAGLSGRESTVHEPYVVAFQRQLRGEATVLFAIIRDQPILDGKTKRRKQYDGRSLALSQGVERL
jgi:hypothetical protein